jgi:tetraacyldisaccharide 4'-kinase
MSLGAGIWTYSLGSMRTAAPTPLQRAWRLVLSLAEVGYQAGVAARAWSFVSGARTVRRLSCPVICVGNLTVGGSGKTPCTITLARWFCARGRAVGILLRGYGRRGSGIVVAADEQGIRVPWEAVGMRPSSSRSASRRPGGRGGNRFLAGQEALRAFDWTSCCSTMGSSTANCIVTWIS